MDKFSDKISYTLRLFKKIVAVITELMSSPTIQTVRKRIRNKNSQSNLDGKKLFTDEEIHAAAEHISGCEFIRTCFLFTSVSFSVLVVTGLSICITNGPIKAKEYKLFSPPVLKGPLTRNELLKNVFPELSAQILGAESFATHETFGTIYTGVKSGHILELKKNQSNMLNIQRSIHLRYGGEQHNCSGSYLDAVDCGRPLGLRFHKKNKDLLLIADAYYGLYEFNVVTADYRILLKPGTPIINNAKARPLRYLNDLDVMEDGETVILSEPSTTFSDRDYLYALMEHGGDGRLLAYNLVNGELKVLLDNLQYPNGVQLEQNGQCVLIAEMGNLQILRYCFNNSYTVAVGNLPGYPDNIRLTENGDLWVPMGGVRFTDDSWLTLRPYLRNIIAKVLPREVLYSFVEYVSPKYGLALIVDSHSGEIKKSFHDPTGVHVPSISQVRSNSNLIYRFHFYYLRCMNLLMVRFYSEVIITCLSLLFEQHKMLDLHSRIQLETEADFWVKSVTTTISACKNQRFSVTCRQT